MVTTLTCLAMNHGHSVGEHLQGGWAWLIFCTLCLCPILLLFFKNSGYNVCLFLTYIGGTLWTLCSSSEAPKPLNLFVSSDGKEERENVLWRTFWKQTTPK